MLEFFRRLFAPEPRSSDTAKERLRLVLLSDHLSLAPEVVEALKRDLLAVISRYLEIDPALADVTFEQREREVAMLASIPIMGVRERSAPLPETMVPQPPKSLVEPDRVVEPQPEDEAIIEPDRPTGSAESVDPVPATPAEVVGIRAEAPGARVEASGAVKASPAQAAPLSASARRRRRKKAAASLDRPSHAHGASGFEPA